MTIALALLVNRQSALVIAVLFTRA